MIRYEDAVNDALLRLDDLGYERGAGDFSNHGPMAAEALAALGHGDQVATWVTRYRGAMEHHEPPTPRFGIDLADASSWRPALGEFGRVGEWEYAFRRELADAPWRDVLTRWWPRLIPGMLSGLTHGPIRTAHAVRSLAATPTPSDTQLTEFARALAYWAARFHPLPGEARLHGASSLGSAIAALPRRSPDGSPMPPPERLSRIGEHPGYHGALDAVSPADPQWLISEMTAEFAGVYLAHPEVFPVPLIHGVTAPAAIRLVLPHLPTELHSPTLAALWQVHVALLLAFTTDRRDEDRAAALAREEDVPALSELIARGAEHVDEHVIKFTEACAREYALRPDARYPAALHAAQQRIPAQGVAAVPSD
ncbi:hypothetical protein HNR23_004771 [Nocardiopsis mwathae]|uniref:DUF4243 domain-containing protein n=1 Tax=Nocardiopsis mwathae TaxID=1472723 RepID=A0A7X0D8G3_9ACTN|nr:questin oxidase family protein [Nocardiopsis mwathae]MBB6174711.1 hypothetical protein [Nocardiopsis mwathae]